MKKIVLLFLSFIFNASADQCAMKIDKVMTEYEQKEVELEQNSNQDLEYQLSKSMAIGLGLDAEMEVIYKECRREAQQEKRNYTNQCAQKIDKVISDYEGKNLNLERNSNHSFEYQIDKSIAIGFDYGAELGAVVKQCRRNATHQRSIKKTLINSIKDSKNVEFDVVENDSLNRTQNSDVNKYFLNFNVIPSDAKIDITNIRDFFHQGMQLKKGKYNVKISKQGYKIYSKTFELTKNSTFDIVLDKEVSLEHKNIPIAKSNNTVSLKDIVTINSNASTITISYPKKVKRNSSISFELIMTNLIGRSKGGLSISFPQFEDSSFIQSISHNGFYSLKSYNRGKKIYSNVYKNTVSSKYVLVEGWSKQWESYDEKRINLTLLPPNGINNIVLDVRGALIHNGYENNFPIDGVEGQQGYFNKRITVNIID